MAALPIPTSCIITSSMGNVMKIVIGEYEFDNKTSLMGFIHEILYKYPLDRSLNIADFEFVCDLLGNHPDSDEKIGVGIAEIHIVEQSQTGKNRHFQITRLDNSSTDFSFLKCIRIPKPYVKFAAACRKVIQPQIVDFRNKSFTFSNFLICPITNEKITASTCHVDHIAPKTFDYLVKEFIKLDGIDVGLVPYVQSDQQIGEIFQDTGIQDRFCSFHQCNAELRVVSKEANLSVLRKKE
jgi:hypothetical protein